MSRILLHGVSLLKGDARSGIPRVVHELAQRCPGLAPQGALCLLVMRAPLGGWVRIERGRVSGLLRWVTLRCQALWRARRSLRLAARSGAWWAALRLPLVWMAYVLASALRRMAVLPLILSGSWVKPGPGDTLVLMDYDIAAGPAVLAARRRGAKAVAIVYDLLPITHPAFFVKPQETAAWLGWLACHADHLLGISHDVELAIRKAWPHRLRAPGHFLLGADFADAPSHAEPAPRVAAALRSPCFLMVGTLEPRKGHGQVLDAFERLWVRGVDAHLLLLGQEGWLVDDLVLRLRRHPELGRRLHWLEDADDAALLAAYRGAVALIAASRGEGFGLPLVEAQAAGLPVIAADIPVLREVGGPAVRFYPPGDTIGLSEIIGACCDNPPERIVGFRWRSWEEAAADFMSQVVQVARD